MDPHISIPARWTIRIWWLGCCLLPWVPPQNYFPLPVLVGAIWLALGALVWGITFRRNRHDGLTGNISLAWTMSYKGRAVPAPLLVGAGLLILAVLASTTYLVLRRDLSGLEAPLVYPLLGGLAVLLGRICLGKGLARHELGWGGVVYLGALWLWVLQYIGTSSYAQLTADLHYGNGPGNISQVAMLASFAVLWTGIRGKGQWLRILVGSALALCLAYWLDSKLLIAVCGVNGLQWALRSQSRWRQRMIALVMLGGGIAALVVLQPGSVQGRLDAGGLILRNAAELPFLGLGPGQMDSFFNQLFYQGEAVNSIGEIGRIAFNDYLQALAETGWLGLLALGLLTVAALRGARPIAALGWILVTGAMFPLQYGESAVLWGLSLAVLVMPEPQDVRGNGEGVNLPWLRYGLPGVAVLTLLLTALLAYRYLEWDRADEQLKGQVTVSFRNQALEQYAALGSQFYWNDEYHFLYARQLTAAGRSVQAEEELQLAVALNPAYLNLAALGDAQFALGRFQPAAESYGAAARLRPKKLYPDYRRVYCLRQTGDVAESEALIRDLQKEFGPAGKPQQQMMLGELERLLVGEGLPVDDLLKDSLLPIPLEDRTASTP